MSIHTNGNLQRRVQKIWNRIHSLFMWANRCYIISTTMVNQRFFLQQPYLVIDWRRQHNSIVRYLSWMVIKRCSEKKAHWSIRGKVESARQEGSRVRVRRPLLLPHATLPAIGNHNQFCNHFNHVPENFKNHSTMSRIFDSSFANCCAWKIHFLPFSSRSGWWRRHLYNRRYKSTNKNKTFEIQVTKRLLKQLLKLLKNPWDNSKEFEP